MRLSLFHRAKKAQNPTDALATQANRIAIKARVPRFGCRQNQGGAVFQITFKVRESRKNFEGSIHVVLSKSSSVYHSIHFEGSTSQLS